MNFFIEKILLSVGLGFLGLLAHGNASMWDDCLLGYLRYLACGPSEHFALQRAWGLLDVCLVSLLSSC